MQLCELINRVMVFSFVGLTLAVLVDYPALAMVTAFVSAVACYGVETYVYPRITASGRRRTVLQAVVIFVVGHAIGIVTMGLPCLYMKGMHPFTWMLYRETIGWGSAMGMGVCAIGTVLYSFQNLAIKNEEQKRALIESSRQAAELRELAAKSETAALRAQINPHFLFNALNTLAYLTEEDPPSARRVVEKLARIFRRTLERSADAMTTLADELEFVADYLAIERERFDDVLVVEHFIDPATLRGRVPTMMLQPLAENAVKHGICPVANGGTLTLRTQLVSDDRGEARLQIILSDDGRGMNDERMAEVMSGSAGYGLANVRERLKLQYGDRADVTIRSRLGEGTVVTIDIPYETADVATPSRSVAAV